MVGCGKSLRKRRPLGRFETSLLGRAGERETPGVGCRLGFRRYPAEEAGIVVLRSVFGPTLPDGGLGIRRNAEEMVVEKWV